MLLVRERLVVLGDLLPRGLAATKDASVGFVVDIVGGLKEGRVSLAAVDNMIRLGCEANGSATYGTFSTLGVVFGVEFVYGKILHPFYRRVGTAFLVP
jgi:hypothetical protein